MTLFAKIGAALTNSSAFASAGSRGTRLLIEGFQPSLEQKSRLPIFAKAPCCLELFGCCCRRLSQHGLGEVLILRRHCWPDAFFCVCVGSGSFCHDWGRTAQFCFGLLMRCLFLGSPPSPLRLLTRQLCGSGCVCCPEFSIIRLKNNSIYLKPDESFVYIGGRVSIS